MSDNRRSLGRYLERTNLEPIYRLAANYCLIMGSLMTCSILASISIGRSSVSFGAQGATFTFHGVIPKVIAYQSADSDPVRSVHPTGREIDPGKTHWPILCSHFGIPAFSIFENSMTELGRAGLSQRQDVSALATVRHTKPDIVDRIYCFTLRMTQLPFQDDIRCPSTRPLSIRCSRSRRRR